MISRSLLSSNEASAAGVIMLDLAAKESIVIFKLLLQCFFDMKWFDFFRLCYFLPAVVPTRTLSGCDTPTKLIVIFLGGIERPLPLDLSVFVSKDDSFSEWSIRKD